MGIDTTLRVDQELVSPESKALDKMQAKLNQWITKGELVKYEIHVLPTGNLLYNICRKKSA